MCRLSFFSGALMFLSWLGRLVEWLISLLLAAMTVVTFVQVVARYLFGYSFSWAFELTTFFFGGVIFIGISYGISVGAHIGVDALVKIMPAGLGRLVSILAVLLCLFYSVIVFIGGWEYVERMYRIGIYAQDVPVKMWIPRVVLPLGFGLMFLRFLQTLIDLLRGKDVALVGDEAEDALQLRIDETDATKQDKP